MKTTVITIICFFSFNLLFAQLNLFENIPVELGISISEATDQLKNGNVFKEVKNSDLELGFAKRSFSMIWKNADSVKFDYYRYSHIDSKNFKPGYNNSLELYFADEKLYRAFFQVLYKSKNGSECKTVFEQNVEILKKQYSHFEKGEMKDNNGSIIGEIIEFRKTNEKTSNSEIVTMSYEGLFETDNKTKNKEIIGYCLWIEKTNVGLTKLHH